MTYTCRFIAISIASIAALLVPATSQAQTQKSLSFMTGKVGGSLLTLNGLVKLRYSGARVASASLDVCFPSKLIGVPDQRVVLPLQVGTDGRLTSAGGQGTIGPVQLKFQGRDGEIRLTGSIRRDGASIAIDEENLNLTEEAGTGDDAPDGEDAGPDMSSANAITFDTKPKDVLNVIKALKDYPVVVNGQSLVPACEDMRADKMSVSLTVSPKKVDEVLKAVQDLPNVSNAKKGGGTFSWTEAILVPKLAQTDGSPEQTILDRAAKVIEKETGGKVTSSENERTGEVSLVVQLPPQTRSGVSVGGEATVEALVEPAPDANGAYILYWRLEKYRLTLPGNDGRLDIEEAELTGEGASASLGGETQPWLSAIRKAFNGKSWNVDESKWEAVR